VEGRAEGKRRSGPEGTDRCSRCVVKDACWYETGAVSFMKTVKRRSVPTTRTYRNLSRCKRIFHQLCLDVNARVCVFSLRDGAIFVYSYFIFHKKCLYYVIFSAPFFFRFSENLEWSLHTRNWILYLRRAGHVKGEGRLMLFWCICFLRHNEAFHFSLRDVEAYSIMPISALRDTSLLAYNCFTTLLYII